MSIALLEAMALGIPLVASSIPGNRRLVSDLEHGRLASADDPEDLARVIIDQWHHFDRAVQMGRAARTRVEQEFSIQTIARKHMALFREHRGAVGSRPVQKAGSTVLNVLQLIPTLDRSGAEKQMVLLAKGLPRDRFRVEVATLTRLGPFEAELKEAGIPVTAIGKHFKLDPIALIRLVTVLEGEGVRRRSDLDFRSQRLWPSCLPHSRSSGGRRGRDGRRPLERPRRLLY